MPGKKNKMTEAEINAELEAKGRKAAADFDDSQALFVPAKKRDSRLISIRLPVAMLNELRDAAIKRGDIGYQQVIKWFIAEGLSKFGATLTPSWAYGADLPTVINTQGSSFIAPLQAVPSVSGVQPLAA